MSQMWPRNLQDWSIPAPQISLSSESEQKEKDVFKKSVPDLQETCTQRKLCQAYQNALKEKEACVTQLSTRGGYVGV